MTWGVQPIGCFKTEDNYSLLHKQILGSLGQQHRVSRTHKQQEQLNKHVRTQMLFDASTAPTSVKDNAGLITTFDEYTATKPMAILENTLKQVSGKLIADCRGTKTRG